MKIGVKGPKRNIKPEESHVFKNRCSSCTIVLTGVVLVEYGVGVCT